MSKPAGHCIEADTKTFYFPPPLDRAIENVLTLKSTADKIITYKLKTSAPNSYAVKKRTGFIEPGASESVHITFRGQEDTDPQKGIKRAKDRFQLELRYLAEDGSEETAYKAIGTSPGSPGYNDLAGAIEALNNSARITGKPLAKDSNASEILGFLWKLQGVKDKASDIVLFNCMFDGLPRNMSERRRKDDQSTGQALVSARGPEESSSSAPVPQSEPSNSIETLQLQLKQKAEENKKLLQSNEELRKGGLSRSDVQQGLPLWLAALIALLSVAAGYLLASPGSPA